MHSVLIGYGDELHSNGCYIERACLCLRLYKIVVRSEEETMSFIPYVSSMFVLALLSSDKSHVIRH
jgi:hypothetical protein